MTPHIVDSVEVPVPAIFFGQSTLERFGVEIELYAMTVEEAAYMREIIDNMSYINFEQAKIFAEISSEVTTPFFLGTQSAADTARILQNRVQRVLDERGWERANRYFEAYFDILTVEYFETLLYNDIGGDIKMPNIKPVSELRNYGEVLRDVAVGAPVFLTKNGHGRYAVLDIEEYKVYEKTIAWRKLEAELEKGRRSGEEQGWIPADDVRKRFEDKYDG